MIAPARNSALRDNRAAASRLRELAQLLEDQGANPFRVTAYRRAAETIDGMPRSYREILTTGGLAGLDRLPGIGAGIAQLLATLARTGRVPMLERLLGERDPEGILATVPFIGPRLAERLHRDLGVESLEDLEAALHDGRLDGLPGLGQKRLAGLRVVLADRLSRRRAAPPRVAAETAPIEDLLDVDRQYRSEAERGLLPTIAPKRFNPEGRAWLPVLHTRRGDKDYTALFSNTAQAHRLDRTHDWVVIYWDGSTREHQATVVTERRGPLAHRRVVRGREEDCLRHYDIPAARPSEIGWFESVRGGEDASPTTRAAAGRDSG